MPPSSMLYESEYSCPDCRHDDTYVHKINDRYLCGDCDFSAPIEDVEK